MAFETQNRLFVLVSALVLASAREKSALGSAKTFRFVFGFGLIVQKFPRFYQKSGKIVHSEVVLALGMGLVRFELQTQCRSCCSVPRGLGRKLPMVGLYPEHTNNDRGLEHETLS
jgi:hypothetical protein